MANTRNWKKSIRYLRWASKAAFLLLFMIPIAYVPPGPEWAAPMAPVVSFLSTSTRPILFLPLTQAPCSVWLNGYCNIEPGAWLACPLGAVQTLLTGRVEAHRFGPLIVAMFIVVVMIILLGNVFCSWACPIGTIVDSFDTFIGKFFHNLEAKRNKRYLQTRQNKRKESGEVGKYLVCPSCPIHKVVANRSGVVTSGIVASALVGSAAVRLPVFCTVCPIGISTRGLMHLKTVTNLTGIIYPLIIELWVFPVMAVLVSIRERRFWCKKVCPAGRFLSGVGASNPFIKPKLKKEKCVMKGCPEDCEDDHIDYCGWCRIIDDRKCEKVCPVDISLVDNGSLHECTKCMECYIVCDYNAIKVDLLGKPEVFRIGGFFRRLGARLRKNKFRPIENQSDGVQKYTVRQEKVS